MHNLVDKCCCTMPNVINLATISLVGHHYHAQSAVLIACLSLWDQFALFLRYTCVLFATNKMRTSIELMTAGLMH